MARPRILIAVGLVLVVAAILVWAIARELVLRFPAGFDLTEQATGSLTLQAEPATWVPQPGPALPVDLRRRLHAVSASEGHVVVQEDDDVTVGQLPPFRLVSRHVLDAGTAEGVSSPQAFAYTPGTVVDRSGTYPVTFPVDAGTGPYSVWCDATGTPLEMTSTSTVPTNGLTLRSFHGRAEEVPLHPAFLAQLGPLGLPQSLTVQQLAPQLTAAGIDPGAVADAIAQLDNSADRTEAAALFTAPVPLAYRLTTDASLLVEPVSGFVVSLDRVNETVTMTPEMSGLGRLQLILGQYASKPVVAAGAAALAQLAAHPPSTPLFTVTYAQDPISVTQNAAYARHRADVIRGWTRTVPLVLAVLGIVAFLAGLVLRRRRRTARPATRLPARESGTRTP